MTLRYRNVFQPVNITLSKVAGKGGCEEGESLKGFGMPNINTKIRPPIALGGEKYLQFINIHWDTTTLPFGNIERLEPEFN